MSDNLIGATTAIFIVSLSIAVAEPVDVAWSTRDGTAKAGTDYQAANGVVSFLPGETKKQIEVIVYGQNVSPTGDKNFFINLMPPTNAVLGTTLIEAVIKVEDEAGVPVTTVIVAQGKRGLKGDPGLSAYEQAVLMGYEGTVEDWMKEQGNAAAAAQRASDYAANAAAAATKAESAATSASFLGNIFPTPEAGVDPVTGVANGAYYNVRSPDNDSFLIEYQNIGGVPTPSGKSYPSSGYVQEIAEYTPMPFVPGKQYHLNQRIMLDNGDIVKNTIEGNTANPNIDMTGWAPGIDADQIFDESGLSQQFINNQRIKTLWDFGATGIGDDAPALQRALDHGYFAITGTHKILSKVYVNNDVYMLGLGGTLKPSVARGVVNFQVSTDIFLMNNVQVDGVNYKGNRNDEHGMYFINAGPDARPKTLVLKANSLKNIYGDGFRAYCDNCDVTGNTLINVAGLNLVNHPSGAYDNYGDGIHIMGAKSGVVAGNYIVNDETTIVDLGRGGVVLEFGVENVSVFGNTIRGYDRGIHAETVLAPLIENNNVDLCGTAVLLSDAPQTIIRNNILLSTTAKTTGLFGIYGTIYDYNGNSSVIEGNVISAGIGRKAILGNGAAKRKFTKINKNRINGDVLITAGAVGAEFSGNIIGETLTSVINITGRSVTDKNTVHNDSYITLAAPSGSVSSNTFESPSVVPLRIANPTNLAVNDNTFNLTAGYSFAYTVDCTAASAALIGECSGNTINSDLSVAMFRYATASAVHHPFICNRPNLLKTSANKISALKFLAPNNFGQRSLTYFSNVSTEPNDGRYYDQGGRVELSAPPATGATGYLVVTSGYAAANAWAATTAYAVGAFVYSGNKSYKCTVAGTSGSIAPTHSGGIATDGTVTWEYLGAKAVFRQLA